MSHKRKNLLDELNKLAPSEAEKLINQYAKSKNKSVPKSLVITYAHDIEKHLDTVTVSCPYCQSTNIIKKGKNTTWFAAISMQIMLQKIYKIDKYYIGKVSMVMECMD